LRETSSFLEIIFQYLLVLILVFIAGNVAALLLLGEPRRNKDNFKKILEELYPKLCGIKWTKYLKKEAPVEEGLRDVFYGLASTGIVDLKCSDDGRLVAKVTEPYRKFLR
jgi:hypothetical protein